MPKKRSCDIPSTPPDNREIERMTSFNIDYAMSLVELTDDLFDFVDDANPDALKNITARREGTSGYIDLEIIQRRSGLKLTIIKTPKTVDKIPVYEYIMEPLEVKHEYIGPKVLAKRVVLDQNYLDLPEHLYSAQRESLMPDELRRWNRLARIHAQGAALLFVDRIVDQFHTCLNKELARNARGRK